MEPSTATPPYTKWFNGFASTPASAAPATARSADAPTAFSPDTVFASGQHDWSFGQPSKPVSTVYHEGFSIPFAQDENKELVSIEAMLDVTYRVEDWGRALLDGQCIIDLSPAREGSDEPTFGGHLEWSGHSCTTIPSGDYTLSFEYENIDMPEELNRSVCVYDYIARPYESGGVKDPEPCACPAESARAATASPSTPPTRSPAWGKMVSTPSWRRPRPSRPSPSPVRRGA